MPAHIADILISILPPVFSISICLAAGVAQNIFIRDKIESIVTEDGINVEYGMLLTHVSESIVTVIGFFSTIISCILSVLIIFVTINKSYSIYFILSSILILILMIKWSFEVAGKRIDYISSIKIPRKKEKDGRGPFHKYTYADLIRRRQYFINIFLIVMILLNIYLS